MSASSYVCATNIMKSILVKSVTFVTNNLDENLKFSTLLTLFTVTKIS